MKGSEWREGSDNWMLNITSEPGRDNLTRQVGKKLCLVTPWHLLSLYSAGILK